MDDVRLRTLALRLLTSGYPRIERLEVRVGQLPDDLPTPIPLPDPSLLLGSVSGIDPSPSGMIRPRTEIFFDTPLPPAKVDAFYRDRLSMEGWLTSGADTPRGGGFQEESREILRLPFYHPGNHRGLWITAHKRGDTETAVQIEVGEYRLVAPASTHALPPPPLPALLPPPGARYLSGWMGGSVSGPTHREARAAIETDVPLANIADGYAAQCAAAGWQQRGEGQDGAVAWSRWIATDDQGTPWDAVVYVMARPDAPRQFLLHVRLDPSVEP